MATGIQCDDCGTTVPSLGSLQMHRLRYHPAPGGSPALGAPPPAAAMRPGRSPAGRQSTTPGQGRGPRPRSAPGGGVAALLGVAIVALLAGGAYAASRPRPDELSTAGLTAMATRAALTPADLPSGWTADPTEPDDGSDDADRALADCLGTPYDDAPSAAEASFSTPGLSVTSDFSIAPSVEWAQADFAALRADKAPGCFEQVMRAMLDGSDLVAGATYDIAVSRLDTAPLVPPALAADTLGLRASITLRRGGLALPMTFDAIMLRHDRIEATLAFNAVGKAGFPADLARSLTGAVANRLIG